RLSAGRCFALPCFEFRVSQGRFANRPYMFRTPNRYSYIRDVFVDGSFPTGGCYGRFRYVRPPLFALALVLRAAGGQPADLRDPRDAGLSQPIARVCIYGLESLSGLGALPLGAVGRQHRPALPRTLAAAAAAGADLAALSAQRPLYRHRFGTSALAG